jgi:SsrA-binding protein
LEIVQSDKGLVKVEIALVKGRKKFDKRELLKKRDIDRSIQSERKKYNI